MAKPTHDATGNVPLDSPRILTALRNVALGVTAAHGEEIFRQLVEHVAQTLEVDFALIGVLSERGDDWVQSIAVYNQGQMLDNVEYSLDGTPCAFVIGKDFEFVPDRLTERFPQDEMMAGFGFHSYAAYPLFDSAGNALGLIAVSDRGPMHNRDVIEATLRIFSVRAAAEIERQQAERALGAREEQYRAIFDASVDGLVLLNPSGRLVDVNQAFADMHGFTREDLLAMDPRLVVHPDSWHRFDTFMDTLRTGLPFHAEADDVRRDGTVVPVEVHGVRMVYQGAAHLLGIVRDITARRRAEVERDALEAQLRQAQKMEAIGHLTGGIAHDFNNILTTILGYAQLAGEKAAVASDPKLANHLSQIRTAGERARDLIRQMLTFSRGERGAAKLVDLQELVVESVRLFHSSFPSNVHVLTAAHDDPPPVLADPVQIEQVLMNLCINARDAIDGAGDIRIEVAPWQGNGRYCSACRQPVDGDYVGLSVVDSGPGIPPKVQERMFEPFFTTKAVGQGSGMGLATAHGVIHDHGGHILVENQTGMGAAVRVLLPVADEAVTGAAPDDRATAPAAQDFSARILLVEDQGSVRSFMEELLVSRGFEVVACDTGECALRQYAEALTGFDIVVTDQSMPGMSGLDLAARLREGGVSVPIVLYTGNDEAVPEGEAKRVGVAAVLRKPVDVDGLLAAMEPLLGQARPA